MSGNENNLLSQRINFNNSILMKNTSINFKKYFNLNKTKSFKNKIKFIKLKKAKDFKSIMEVLLLEDKPIR